MSDTVDKAPPSSALALMDSNPAIFTKRDETDEPCVVTLPGSSNLALALFNVTATGTIKPTVPGTVILTLYGRANLDDITANPSGWLPLASAPAEPIGGATDLPEAMFMVQACDLMANPKTGKIQGCFKSNVASNPQAPIDLTQHPGDVTEEDPLYVFTVGASFTPAGALTGRKSNTKVGERLDEIPLATLTLTNLTLSA